MGYLKGRLPYIKRLKKRVKKVYFSSLFDSAYGLEFII